jgi:molecular chaperone DnaK (HSP70)
MKLTKSRLKEIIAEEIKNLDERRYKLSSDADMTWSGNNIVIMSGNKRVVLSRKELGKLLKGAKMHRLAAGYKPTGNDIKEDSLGDTFHRKIKSYQDRIRREKEAYRKAKERQQKAKERKSKSQKKESKINEVDFNKIKLPSMVDRFLNRFVSAMKSANLNRLKRSAILYKVIDASGMTPQRLMADIQKIKKELK